MAKRNFKKKNSKKSLKLNIAIKLKWNGAKLIKKKRKTGNEKNKHKLAKKREKNKKYYVMHKIQLRNKQKHIYRNNVKNTLMLRKLKYENIAEYRARIKFNSVKYYEVHKRRKLESFKLSYQDNKCLRLLKSRVIYSSKILIYFYL